MTHVTEGGLGKLHLEDSKVQQQSDFGFNQMVSELRSTFLRGKTRDLEWRRRQLRQILKLVQENQELITDAILKEHGSFKFRGLAESLPIVAEVEAAIANLDSWASPRVYGHGGGDLLGFMNKYPEVRPTPKGVVLIISPWNYPINLLLIPAISAIAAGNCVVLKPSEVTKHVEKLLCDLIPKYLDPECVKVVSAGVAGTKALLEEKFDHIVYTGNGFVARKIMEAAAKHLCPVTLELGGKSPVLVDRSAKISTAAGRIIAGKFLNVGQTCIAPDYIIVHRSKVDELVRELKSKYDEHLEGNSAEQYEGYGKIVNKRHHDRLRFLLEKSKGTFVTGGLSDLSRDARHFGLTIVTNPDLTEPMMTEEIFGPILPVVTFETEAEALDKMSSVCSRPLAMYIFSEDNAFVERALRATMSGSVVVNSCNFEQNVNHHLPFGGTGESGTGMLHGQWGFDELSHFRSIVFKDTRFVSQPSIPMPKVQAKIYDVGVKLKITGLLSKKQKKIIKYGGAAAATLFAAAVIGSKL